jgi:hypothetical protein
MTQWGLDTLFNPAKRHMDDEKRRLQSTREEIGDSSGGKRINLESGKVTIERKPRAEDEIGDELEGADDEAHPKDAADDAHPKDAAAAEPKAKERPAPSPAAIRAAQRRGRKPR